MVVKHSVTRSFSNGWDTLGYILVFKCSGHIRLHTRFQLVVPHPVSHSFSSGWTHLVTHSFSYGRDISGYTFVFKCLGQPQLHTRFQIVATHSVARSFLKDRVAPVYTLVFRQLGHLVTCSFLIVRDTLDHPLFFKWSCHNRLPIFLSNGWDTLSYMFVFKRSWHNRLHTLFQK